MDEIRGNKPEQTGMPPLTASNADATQRLPLQNPRTPAQRSGAAPQPGSSAAAARRRKKKEKERLTTIILLCVTALLLIGIIIAAVSIFSTPEDNGQILNNIYAAGVNIGGMTQEQAKAALHQATDHTYSKLDMIVTVLDSTITLSPGNTGASLDVDAIVQAAYDRGRTGSRSEQQQARAQALVSAYHIPITPYLNLNTEYIRSQVNELGKKYSTTLSQSTYSISGEAPSMDMEEKDPSVVYQTLTIHVGTAEYGFSSNKLYNQIIDAYGSNLFQVTGECSVLAPDALDFEAIYNHYCVAPKDAVLINPDTYEITPDSYGYGFELEALKLMVTGAEYGTTLEIPLKFIRPNLTVEDLTGEAFKDTLSSFQTKLSASADYNHNLKLVCNILNNLVIRPDETFSFNTAVGQPTTKNGFKTVKAYLGKEYTDVVGGGISQVASTLYYCALMADLQIVERVNHYYTPDYCDLGMDADINYGNVDLRFTNTTGQPIRIQASVSGEYLEIVLIGSANKEYYVTIETEIVKTFDPITLLMTLPADNQAGYKAGDILVTPLKGYVINIYRCVYRIPAEETDDPEAEPSDDPVAPVTEPDAEPDTEPDTEPEEDPNAPVSRELLNQSYYEKRNQVVVSIQSEITPDPTDPTDTSLPSESTDVTESTGVTESTEATA